MNIDEASLRDRQKASTRELILDAAMELLGGAGEPFSHEAIAARAGTSARTAYRHFPRRSDLFLAIWQRLREETRTRFPETEDDLLPYVLAQFRHFEEHEALVRASLESPASVEILTHGWREGRDAFRMSLSGITVHLTASQTRRLIAVCVAIYSAPFWRLLRDRGELSGEEAADAAAWAMEAVLRAAREVR